MHRRPAISILKSLGLLALAIACWSSHGVSSTHAQNPLTQLASQKSDEPQEEEKKDPEKELADWQESVSERLKESAAQIEELSKEEGQKIPERLKEQQELLSWLDLTLSQLEAEWEKSEQLAEYLEARLEALENFVQQGLSEESTPFSELDRTQDSFEAELQRQKSLESRVESFTEALETAREEQKRRASQRRIAREAVETNDDDSKRQELGEELAEAELLCEIAEATAQLRKKTLDNVKASLKAQKTQVKMLREKVARMRSVAEFGKDQLDEVLAEIKKKEDSLKKKIDKLQASAKDGFNQNAQLVQEQLRLLRQQQRRLSAHENIWQQRQKIYLKLANSKDVREWSEKTAKAIESLNDEAKSAALEISDLRSQIAKRQEALEDAEENSAEARRIENEIKDAEALLKSHQANLASIEESGKLHQKLINELDTGSLASTAKDKLLSIWSGVQAIWNQELAVVGDSPLTVRKVVIAILMLLIGVVASRMFSRFLGTQVLRRLDIDPSASATIQSLLFYTFLLMFTLFSLKVINVPLTALTFLGGALALGVGFGSQNVINNFISGLILHAERPVKVGDLILLDDLYGNVEHIGARSTRVRTGSNLEIIVPNSTFLQNNVINYTLSSDKVRTSVEVGVVYGSPVVTVTQLLRRAVVETGRTSKDPPPIILFKEFGDNSLAFEIHFWIRMRTVMDRLQVESAVRYQIEQLFKEAGIVIAFPQRDVHLDTSSPLKIEMSPPPEPIET